MNPFTAAVVHRMLEQGDQAAHLHMLKTTYRRRMESMDQAISRHLGTKAKIQRSRGGYFRWLKFDNNLDTTALMGIARQAGVKFQPGTNFSARKNLANCIRLCWAYYDEADIDTGIKRIGDIFPY
jgi:DNA-binding transcriptional MocR family regulator